MIINLNLSIHLETYQSQWEHQERRKELRFTKNDSQVSIHSKIYLHFTLDHITAHLLLCFNTLSDSNHSLKVLRFSREINLILLIDSSGV